MSGVTVRVNGADWDLPEGSTVADVTERLGTGGQGVAVALNGAVVPRSAWPTTGVAAGAVIEVVTATQGG